MRFFNVFSLLRGKPIMRPATESLVVMGLLISEFACNGFLFRHDRLGKYVNVAGKSTDVQSRAVVPNTPMIGMGNK